ncbi:hypothetical protein ABT160_02060 [Streptomyces sp. NPDC001941]|uniref:hypothetical protein n=1 Tax=Streptomyces sp. NPDC001941 TaxID=3154659 RepID=UPI00331D03EE
MKLSELAAPLTALRVLAADFPELPAPCVGVSTVYPGLLSLSFFDDFAEFEAWREALGVDVGSVVHHVQYDGRTAVLKVRTTFAGTPVELVGYSTLPAAEPAEVVPGVGS